MANSLSRFLGGRPASVLIRIILLSILIGFVLHSIGLDPLHIWRSIERLFRMLWNMGFDVIIWLWRYFLLGAIVVIPIWIIMRIAKGRG